MSDIKMRALRDHPFGTGIRVNGEEYTANESEAKVLVSLGWAAHADKQEAKTVEAPKPAKAAKGYKTRDMKAKG